MILRITTKNHWDGDATTVLTSDAFTFTYEIDPCVVSTVNTQTTSSTTYTIYGT